MNDFNELSNAFVDGKITTFGLLILAITSFIKGWIVPRARYDEIKEDRDDWKDAWTISEQVNKKNTETLEKVLVSTDDIYKIVRAILPPYDNTGGRR